MKAGKHRYAVNLLLALAALLSAAVLGELGLRLWKPRQVMIQRQPAIYLRDELLGSRYAPGASGLMHRCFEIDNLDYQVYRISVLARQGFHVYLNGHMINTYVWWKDEPQYRPIPLEPGHIKYLKKGRNLLAVYANAEFDRRTQESFAEAILGMEKK